MAKKKSKSKKQKPKQKLKTKPKPKPKSKPKQKEFTKQELLQKLREAKRKEKQLSDYKQEKDSVYRKKAREEVLTPVTDLNADIRRVIKTIKGTKGEIVEVKDEIKKIQNKNRENGKKAAQLKKEYPFVSQKRKKEIDRLLGTPDYRQKDASKEKNRLAALQGKDFNFIVDDGFKRHKINTKDIKKIWKKGGDVSLPILKKMKLETEEAIVYYNDLIKKEKKTATKQRMKKLLRIRDGLKNKLDWTLKQNIKAIETGNLKELDKVSDKGEKAYSMIFKVIDVEIDKITI